MRQATSRIGAKMRFFGAPGMLFRCSDSACSNGRPAPLHYVTVGKRRGWCGHRHRYFLTARQCLEREPWGSDRQVVAHVKTWEDKVVLVRSWSKNRDVLSRCHPCDCAGAGRGAEDRNRTDTVSLES